MENIIDLLIEKQYNTKTGPVYLSECEVLYYDIDFALTRLLDLHLRATKQVPIINTENHFNHNIAKELFSVSVITMNASILTFSNTEIEYFLNKLLDVCYKAQSTKCFESVFFTALNCYDGDNEYLKEYYYQKFTSFGDVIEFGGGFNNSYFIDKENGAFIGFDKNINDLIKKSKLTTKSYFTLKERILAERATKMDCLTGIAVFGGIGAISGSVAGGPVGTVVGGITGGMIGCYVGYKSDEMKENVRKKANEIEKIYQDSENPNNKEDDDKDDEFPEKPESTDNPEGCILNPLYSDYKMDPYSNFSKVTKKSVLAIGRGFRSYVFRTENNIYTISKMPKIEISKSGIVNINKLGFLNDFPNYKNELEKTQITYINSLKSTSEKPKNQANLFIDLTYVPNIDLEKDSGYFVESETIAHTAIDDEGNEIKIFESLNTIVFTNPVLIALYGNSITVSSEQLENLKKIINIISKSKNMGVIDIPKNAGEFKLNKYN